MFGIIQWIGAVLLWAGGTKDGDNRDAYCGCQVHRAAIIADEEIALFKLRSQFPNAGFARNVADTSYRHIQPI
jgi:hypothetical protein